MKTQLDKLIENNSESALLHRIAYAKDIAIGFVNYCDGKRMSINEFDKNKPIVIHINSYESLFNEYLNTLK